MMVYLKIEKIIIEKYSLEGKNIVLSQFRDKM